LRCAACGTREELNLPPAFATTFAEAMVVKENFSRLQGGKQKP